jgi:subtilase family serine protease
MKASRFFQVLSVVLLCAFVTPQLFAQFVLPNHTPGFALPSNDLGAANPNESMTVKVWLQVHNAALLDQNIAQIYDPNSSRYRQFLTLDQVKALHAPDAKEVGTVQKFLQGRGLRVSRVGEQNLYVEATGSVSAVQNAFKVQLHNYRVNGQVVRANSSNPTIDDATVGSLVATVSGLSNTQMKPHNVRPRDPSGKVFPGAAVSPNGLFFEGDCFRGVETRAFSTTSTAAVYKGSRFGADITNTNPPDLPPCGYSPQNMYAAYNLTKLYNNGLDGTGQGVVIVDAYGSTTIASDLATFDALYGLPDPSLTVVGTPIAPGTNATIQGWMDETTLDVEWAHSIAPGAKIVLVVSPTANSDDLAAAITTAVVKGYGNVISNSYGGQESSNAPADFAAFEGALKLAAVVGVAVNFSSADDGDFVVAAGFADVSYPASSKLATGIGGTSVFLNARQKIKFQTGWGTNLTRIAGPAATGSIPDVPPITEGFQFGAGGGVSNRFSKPSFQKSLPGSRRLVPDIGWVADPYTGVEIIETDLTYGSQFVGVIGGTSVACPMFSGLWAVAAQKHGGALGQAAASLYRLPKDAITDVTALAFGTNVTGAIKDSTGAIKETARELATPTPQIKTFTSAFYNSPFSTSWFVITFGTDSSLPVTAGWDQVTGLGTPNGFTFVTDVAK